MTSLDRPDTKVAMADASSPEASEFAAIYARHFTQVWSALRRFGVPGWLLEDATQDVFLVWYRQRDQFRGESQVSTYLHAIARRVAANTRRTVWRTERRYQALMHDAPRPAPSPEELVAQHQTAEAFQRAVAGLPNKLREVYLLAVKDGLSAQQIGLALGMSSNTVSSRIRLTRARLAAELRVEPPARADGADGADDARGRVWAMLVPLLPRESAARHSQHATPHLALAAALAATVALVATITAAFLGGELARPVTTTPGRSTPASVAAPASVVAAPPAPAPRSPAPTRQGDDDRLAREARMLAAAQRHLREGAPEAALTQLRLHATRFADGALAEERDALLAAALCQGGDFAAGRAATQELAARAPTSAALATARVACEAAP